MEEIGSERRKGKNKQVKQAAAVSGALTFRWLAIEMALEPFLDKAHSAMDKSDPTRDLDDVSDHPNLSPQGGFDPAEGKLAGAATV